MAEISRRLIFIAFAFLGLSCNKLQDKPVKEVTVEILLGSGIADNNPYNDFSPYELKISAGTSVTWVNKDTMTHSVNSEDSLFDSPLLSPGDKYTFTFNNPGDYRYFCQAHRWMRGKVLVR